VKPTPEQLARINQLAKSPLTEDQVYVFNGKLIGDNPIPNRFERVTPNFLRKMAQQAKDGVALMIDHSWRSFGSKLAALPYGRTFDSSLKQEPDGELALYADHYIVRGQTLNGLSTDDIISAIDAGTMFDTSIGYGVTKAICSIDGLDYYGGKCMHWRGEDYDGEVCSVDDDDGYLMENSLVFDGAYPGAGVVAASKTGAPPGEEHQSNWALTEDAKALKSAERVLFSFSQKRGLQTYVEQSGAKQEGVDQVDELAKAQSQVTALSGVLTSVRTALGVASDDAVEGALNALKAQAQIGQQYATKVTDEALAAGVRAQGAAFNAEAMKAALSHLPVSEVEKIRDSYNAQAPVVLGGGGQHVVTAGSELPEKPNENPHAQSQGGEVDRDALRREAREALSRNGHADVLTKEAK
jgi:hypothetical protein